MDIEKCLILEGRPNNLLEIGRPNGLLEEASPGQHEGVGHWQECHSLEPPAAGLGECWPANTPTPQPTGADSLQSPALSQPCCKPKKTQFCVLHDMADSSPGVVDAQIGSGFAVWSTLERRWMGQSFLPEGSP